ncbi:putative ribosome biogenesis GTPase RsgA [compost metagenome]
MTERAWGPDAGVVIRRITNYYTVRFRGEDYVCLPRARLKKERVAIHVGDRVLIEEIDLLNRTGTVAEVLPRFNMLPRPPIANVDQAVLVFSADRPAFNPMLLDRFLVLVAQSGIDSAIAINKADLLDPEALEALVAPYRAVGYPVVTVSAERGDVEPLRALLAGKETVFAGPSGVGKSSLLNALEPGLALKAAEVSAKIQRGRHTTTYASLYALETAGETAYVADTPGYSHLGFGPLHPTQLGWLFPEMAPHIPDCRFPDCLHRGEPGCAVAERAQVAESRFASYLRFLEELEATEERLASTSTKNEGAVKRKAAAGGGETKLIRLAAGARDDSRRKSKQRLRDLHLEEPEDDEETDGQPDDQVLE